jgi:cell division protein FtsI/penicillin-binding protein 2
MWREPQIKKRSKEGKVNNNRWRLVVAIIFLLIGSLVYKLYNIQISQCDFYTAIASSQHQFYNQLIPERGKIYFSEEVDGEEKLYPLATNKEFAEVFVVPKDIINPEVMAEKMFIFFDKPKLEKEFKEETATDTDFVIATSTKEEIISSYLKKLDKPGDPYEPLIQKMPLDDLIRFYSFLSSSDYNSTSSAPLANPEELNIKFGKIIYRDDPDTEFIVDGLGFNLQNYRFYPEQEIAAHLVGFSSQIDGEIQGQYGLEGFFNTELFGQYGFLKSDKANKSNLMIINDREYVQPQPGNDLILTVDRNIEFIVCDKLKQVADYYKAEGGSIIVMNPKTGAIIAMCSFPDFNPNNYKDVENMSFYNNPAIFYQYEPGSVFKTVTMAIAIDQEKISPATTYEDKGQIMISGWPKPIRNSDFFSHGPHGVVDMSAVLDNSLNTGAIFAMNQVGPKIFAEYVKNFGFGERTGIELGAESPGNINNLLSNKVKEIDAATASFGQGIAVTPLQMLMPYQAIANKGLLMKPYVVKSIVYSDGRREDISPKAINQIISEKTAATVSAMLVNVVEKGHSQKAAISGYYIGGKTGTAQIATAGGYSQSEYSHTFIGIAPIENPVFVMLVKIDKPKGVQYAEGSVVPLWRDIAEFILNYYAVPKDR